MTTNWTKTGGKSWRVTFTDPPEPTALDVWMQDSGMNTYLSAFPAGAQPRGYATRSGAAVNTWARAVLENSEGPEQAPQLRGNPRSWGRLK